MDLGAWSPWGRFLRIRQQIDELLYAEMKGGRMGQGQPSEPSVASSI